MSVVSDVFELPGQGAKEGSVEWIESVFKTDSYSFKDLVDHRKLMNKHLRKFAKTLNEDGQLPLSHGEVVPARLYTRDQTYEYLSTGLCKK